MSDALTDTTENRAAEASAPAGAETSGRHRGTHSPADQAALPEPVGHGRHRRADQPPAAPGAAR